MSNTSSEFDLLYQEISHLYENGSAQVDAKINHWMLECSSMAPPAMQAKILIMQYHRHKRASPPARVILIRDILLLALDAEDKADRRELLISTLGKLHDHFPNELWIKNEIISVLDTFEPPSNRDELSRIYTEAAWTTWRLSDKRSSEKYARMAFDVAESGRTLSEAFYILYAAKTDRFYDIDEKFTEFRSDAGQTARLAETQTERSQYLSACATVFARMNNLEKVIDFRTELQNQHFDHYNIWTDLIIAVSMLQHRKLDLAKEILGDLTVKRGNITCREAALYESVLENVRLERCPVLINTSLSFDTGHESLVPFPHILATLPELKNIAQRVRSSL